MLVIDETVLPSDSLIFQEEVRTSLPFRARAFPAPLSGIQPYPFGLMCSQDNIIVRRLLNIFVALVNICHRSFLFQHTMYLR